VTLKLEEVDRRNIVSYLFDLNGVPLLLQMCRVTRSKCCLIVSKLCARAATSKVTVLKNDYVEEALISGIGVDEREATFMFSMKTDYTLHLVLDSIK
jgi:hypothetical protein